MTDDGVLDILVSRGFSVYFRSFSSIDSYLGSNAGTAVRILTDAGMADLARPFEDLRYPGIGLADAALDRNGRTYYFRCADIEETSDCLFSAKNDPSPFTLLEFYQNWETGRFYDPRGIYPLLREIRKGAGIDSRVLRDGLNHGAGQNQTVMECALILAKYFSDNGETGKQAEKAADLFRGLPQSLPPKEEEQRLLLTGLLTAPSPGLGLEFLKKCGFVGEFWPELAVLDEADHSKEFHPEGNAWKHTMETFRYRKAGPGGARDLRLSLGLLLHDTGKPIAASAGSHRFDGHAELGERQARRLLERLGFAAPLVSDVCYLVKNHMLPAALPRLPLARTGEIMASPLFPVLLELYRCDESSSFKGLEGYYESSAAYQSYLRNRRNPYRSADGKKLGMRCFGG
jgi:poly(A) polymerase